MNEPQPKRKKLQHQTPAIHARIRYICETLFAGSLYSFSRVLNLNQRHVGLCFYGKQRVTVNMLAQIVTKTNVRAEWLLTGAGPILAEPEGKENFVLAHADSINSVFNTFDLTSLPACPVKTRVKKTQPGEFTAIAAAKSIHAARVAGRPVVFFLGADAAAQKTIPHLVECVSKNYLTGAVLTAGCVRYDSSIDENFDANYVAKLAAMQGVGYGEALARWAASQKPAASSLLHATWNLKVPVTVHLEIGEFDEHLLPALHGLEVGVAAGAAAYVDLLVFMAQVHEFRGAPGGVFVLCGEAARGWRIFAKALAAVRTVPGAPELTSFTVILLGPENDSVVQANVCAAGGNFHFVSGDYLTALPDLIGCCDAVYAGTIQ